MLVENLADPPLELFFLTWPMADDRHDSWVRIQAATKVEALAFVVKRYGTHWAELLPDVSFNPDLYRDGELAAFRIEPREGTA